jgi:hypothetical protein
VIQGEVVRTDLQGKKLEKNLKNLKMVSAIAQY